MNTAHNRPVSARGFVGEFTLASAATTLGRQTPRIHPRPDISPTAFVAEALLSGDERQRLVADVHRQAWVEVGANGIYRDYRPGDQIGSYRASAYSEALAGGLWARLGPVLPERWRLADGSSDADWIPVGVNPLFRFINYQPGGMLVPHYDAPADIGQQRTLLSLVIYLEHSAGVSGGATRFLHDRQDIVDPGARDWSDWSTLAAKGDIRAVVESVPGNGLVFDHRLLHDAQPISGSGTKLIARTDLVYARR
jgi:hypothetical protein